MPAWKKEESNRAVSYRSALKEKNAEPAAVHAALAVLWTKVLDETDKRYPQVDWDILICYLTVEIGGVLVYPAKRPRHEWADARVTVTLDIRTWEDQYREFESLVEEDEKRFERSYDKQLKRMTDALKAAVGDERVLPKRRSQQTAFCQGARAARG